MLSVPTWEDLCAEAVRTAGNSTTLESLFTDEELRNNELALNIFKFSGLIIQYIA